jgi:hypothetical protein
MVYQNHRLENIDLVEKVDGHRDTLGSHMYLDHMSLAHTSLEEPYCL